MAVASDHHLVAESVRAALLSRDFDVVVVGWPSSEDPLRIGAPRRLRRRWVVGPPPDVGVVLSDLSTVSQVFGAQLLLSGLDLPWLVLTTAPEGPTWGAVYDQGATLVLPSETSLDTLCSLLADVSAGRAPREPAERRELIRAWRSFRRHTDDLEARINSLTGREDDVLEQLYEGLAVRAIAERADVTESTVRSQVKAILRKLDVNSQIAAVAAYQEVLSSSVARRNGRSWDSLRPLLEDGDVDDWT